MTKIGQLSKKYRRILTDAGRGFLENKGMKLSSSLAYNTIFALPPMLLLIFVLSGAVFGQDALQGKIYAELREVVGSRTALQVQDIIRALQFQRGSLLATLIGTVALLLGATGVFVEIQDSLNMIWGVRTKPKKGFVKLVLNRLISFSMVIGLGFLLIVSLLVNTLLTAMSRYLLEFLPRLPVNVIGIVNNLVIFSVISVLFSFIFKMLPDVRIRWRYVWPGAFVTAALFLMGQFLIGLYLRNTHTASLYGAASSVIVLLLWIYFSAVILYFGAEFTRAYIEYHGKTILPNSYAEYSDRRQLRHLKEKYNL